MRRLTFILTLLALPCGVATDRSNFAFARAGTPPLPALHVATLLWNHPVGVLPLFVVWLAQPEAGTDGWMVSTTAVGAVGVERLTRDGATVEPERATLLFDAIPHSRLTALNPGDSVQLKGFIVKRRWGSREHGVLQTFSLSHRPRQEAPAPDPTHEKLPTPTTTVPLKQSILIYPVTRPGSYVLKLYYLYTGPDEGYPNVLRKKLVSNEITFMLSQ
jgi:hypothetical protein